MEFLTILKESIKLLPKNGKLMALIALFSMLLASTFFKLFHYYLLSLSHNMLVTIKKLSLMPHPTSFNIPHPKSFGSTYPRQFTPQTGSNPVQMFIGLLSQDFALILGLYITWFLVISIILFFFSISTIIVSGLSYKDKSSSLKGLISRIQSTWTRPCITSLYVSALAYGYFFAVVILVSPFLIYPSRATYCVPILIGIKAFVFYLHLVVPWNLAIIVSILEESCYGLEALVKGAQLIKGKRFHGFLLNLCFSVVVFIIFQGCKTILGNKGYVINPTLYGLFLVSAFFLAKIFQVVAYTVLYFHCKKHHGEEIELKGSFHYAKLPTTQLANDIP